MERKWIQSIQTCSLASCLEPNQHMLRGRASSDDRAGLFARLASPQIKPDAVLASVEVQNRTGSADDAVFRQMQLILYYYFYRNGDVQPRKQKSSAKSRTRCRTQI